MNEETQTDKRFPKGCIIAIVVLIVLFLAIAIPSFIKARSTTAQNGCINNLRMIQASEDRARAERVQSTMQTNNIGANKSIHGTREELARP